MFETCVAMKFVDYAAAAAAANDDDDDSQKPFHPAHLLC